MPKRPAFKGSASVNLLDHLHEVLRWALGLVEILFSKHCPIWYGYGCDLKPLGCFHSDVVIDCETISLWSGFILFMLMLLLIAVTSILEIQWGGVRIDDFCRNEQFWVIGGVSVPLFTLFRVTVTSKGGDDGEFAELYLFKWTLTLLVFNIIGVVVGISMQSTMSTSHGAECFGVVLCHMGE
ncbi:putative cellulose synthase (UDP-forming) [Helianthus anomalus]